MLLIAATWLVQADVSARTAAGYLDMSVGILLDTYGHDDPIICASHSRSARRC
jgi:hypothetical protein